MYWKILMEVRTEMLVTSCLRKEQRAHGDQVEIGRTGICKPSVYL